RDRGEREPPRGGAGFLERSRRRPAAGGARRATDDRRAANAPAGRPRRRPRRGGGPGGRGGRGGGGAGGPGAAGPAAGGLASEADERRWQDAAEASQQQLIAQLGAAGLRLRPEFSYTRVLSGFSAPLDARAIALLQRFPEVEGVYPVRIAYPAAVSSTLVARHQLPDGAGYRAQLSLPRASGRGVTIALIDTGIQLSHDYLTGAVQEGVDLLERDDSAPPKTKPDDPSERERHATELGGLIVGSGGPGNLHGVAENATILPIRAGGWQRDVAGRWSVYSRT